MKVAYDFLCLDERDSPNLKELTGKSRKDLNGIKNKRFFGLCGVIVPGALYPELNIEGRTIQEKVLGQGRFQPFHYVEILNKAKKWSWLGVNKSKHTSVCVRLDNLVAQNKAGNKYKIIASFVDKTELARKYGKFPLNRGLTEISKIKPNMSSATTPRKINLYMISLKVIIQKYVAYLKEKNKRGLIIAEARGEVEDMRLLDAFYKFQKSGAGTLSGKEIRSHITDLLIIRKSQNHIGCQLADMITYPLFDYFVPGHNVRNDHFIKKDSIEKKILSIDIFPKKNK